MGLLHEDRLVDTVHSGEIGIREYIEIRNRMGDLVSSGEVISSTPWGVVVKEESGKQAFYGDNLYLFSVLEPDEDEIIPNTLADMSPDSRVEMRLAQMEAGDMQPGSSGSARGNSLPYGKDGDGEQSKPKMSPVDTEKLPDDIKKAILSSNQMGEDQINSVLGEISDAAMKGLKRIGVKESELFKLIGRLQDSVYKVLSEAPTSIMLPRKSG